MDFRHQLLTSAEQDLDETIHWYMTENSESLARRFYTTYQKTIEQICSMPSAYALLEEDYRWKAVGKFPYKIIYRIEEDTIIVVAIAHNKRHPNFWKDRIN